VGAINLFDPPILRSERLELSPIGARDASAVQRIFADDPMVTRFVAWRPLVDPNDAQRFVDREDCAWREAEECRGWIARDSASGDAVGCAIARRHDGGTEFSYVVLRSHWNRGIATEIARIIVDRARLDDDVLEIAAVCDVENLASKRVLEKAGMVFDCILPRHQRHNVAPEPRDCLRFVLPG
jgi:RimJ/RimL family protein N-acetyltransferase